MYIHTYFLQYQLPVPYLHTLNCTVCVFAIGSDFEEEKRFPHAITIREAFTSFLDITTPPTPQLLKLLATQAMRHEDIMDIEALARGEAEYEEWKYNYYPSMSEVIDWFYSLHGHVDPCLLLSQLPVLQSVSYKRSLIQIYASVYVHKYVNMIVGNRIVHALTNMQFTHCLPPRL